MKTIVKQVSLVTKVLFVALLITGVSVNSYAQKEKKAKKEKILKRPAKVGHSATDSYVTSAFNLYEKNQKITKQLSDAKGNIADAGKVKNELEQQMKEVKGLLGKSADVLKQAKGITPKTNSLKAVKAVNAGTKALNATQAAIPGQLDAIKAQSGAK